MTQPRQNQDAPKIDKRHRLEADDWVDSGRWVRVSSSNVSAIMFDKLRERIYVEFLPSKKFPAGSVYFYLSCPAQLAKDLFNAGSIGIFLNSKIKGVHAFAGPFGSREIAP